MTPSTTERLRNLGNLLLTLAGAFVPGHAVTIEALRKMISAVTEANNLLKEIREQTEETAPEVWAKVKADFEQDLAALRAAIRENQELLGKSE